MDDVRLSPKLIVVSGQPGSGKTTLAHCLAQRIGCPAICRDEIKEGMVHAYGSGFLATTADPLTQRTFPLFFECLRLLLSGGVTVVAEAAFQHRLWSAGLMPLVQEGNELRIIRCHATDHIMTDRRRQRLAEAPTRAAHADGEVPPMITTWDPISLDHPTLDVDTSDGYSPGLDHIAAVAGS